MKSQAGRVGGGQPPTSSKALKKIGFEKNSSILKKATARENAYKARRATGAKRGK